MMAEKSTPNMGQKSTKKVVKAATAARVPVTKNKAISAKRATPESSDQRSAKERIDTRISELTDFRGACLTEVRKLIHEVDPDVTEDWKWMGTPVWSNNGMYVLANPHKDKVKITFFHGAQLTDPKKLFNNGLDGNKWRAIDLHEGDKLNKTAFKALLREAIAYNKTNPVAKSKGSRTKS